MHKMMLAVAVAAASFSTSPVSAAKQCFDAKHKFTKCGGPNDVTTAKAMTPAAAPAAIACKDGSASKSTTTRGACSGHGGIKSAK